MDPSNASYKRFWQPSYAEALGLSLFAGCIATSITHPIDFIKTVIQFRSQGVGLRGYKVWQQGYNPFKIMREMHSKGGGFLQFYGGFEANLIARLGYLGIRNTLYKVIYDMKKPTKLTNDLTVKEKMLISGFSGGIAAFITSPLTLISIRQILDTQTRPEWRRNYGTPSQALKLLTQTGALWKGSLHNVIRHIALNVSITLPYDKANQGLWNRFGDYGFVEPLALIYAAFVSAIVTLPFDNIRTRIMQAHDHPERNRLNYRSTFDIVSKSITYEGRPYALWAGFATYYLSTLVYASLTVGITSAFTESWKRKNGLKQWQI